MEQKNSRFLTALWFIPLTSCVLAGICVFIFWLGCLAFTGMVPPKGKSVDDFSDVNTNQPPSSEDVIVKAQLNVPPKWLLFEVGVLQCLAKSAYPEQCGWEDNEGRNKFEFDKASGEVIRSVYNKDNELISRTRITQNGSVKIYGENNTIWLFGDDGTVTDILVGKENVSLNTPTDPHDTYTYNKDGKLIACTCWDDETCCAIAPDLQRFPRTYCEMFAPDDYLCPR